MGYAIIDFQGHQHQVKEGQELVVDQIDKKPGEQVKIEKVLLISGEKEVKVGAPLVKGAAVTAKIIEHLRGKKNRVATFKAKSRYRRVKGFRARLTKLKIEKITS